MGEGGEGERGARRAQSLAADEEVFDDDHHHTVDECELALKLSNSLEPTCVWSTQRRPIPPVEHIPSQTWCAHAAEDDARLSDRL